MGTGLYRHAELESRMNLPGPFLTADLRQGGPPDRRGPDPRPIDAHVELMRFGGEPPDTAVGAALVQSQLDPILAVDRELVPERHSATRSPREVLTETAPL